MERKACHNSNKSNMYQIKYHLMICKQRKYFNWDCFISMAEFYGTLTQRPIFDPCLKPLKDRIYLIKKTNNLLWLG